jgi:hypothetical protein
MRFTGLSFLTGMLFALLILVAGNFFFDKEDQSTLVLLDSFKRGYGTQVALMSNRTSMRELLSKGRSLSADEAKRLESLWDHDHVLIIGAMADYLESNKNLSSEFKINDGAGRVVIREWAEKFSGTATKKLTKNKFKMQ